MKTAEKISYFFMIAMLLVTVIFHLAHVMLASLFAFMLMEFFFRLIKKMRLPDFPARTATAIAFLLAVAVVAVVFVKFLKQTLLTFPGIVESALPQVSALAQRYGIELPFSSFGELRELLNSRILGHALTITKASTFLTREAFHIAIGIVAVVLFFISGKPPQYCPNLFDAVRRETNRRIRKFMHSFERVFGAQIIISSINAVLTMAFLYITGIPHLAFLTTMTFLIGIIPILGNIISNSVIAITALGISFNLAMVVLAYLVIIHKLEYFLNSKIMGSSVRLPMWQMLLAILLGNVIMGVSGIMLAPALLHYIKSELKSIPWKTPGSPADRKQCPE
ncbi:MAG: AI-2E family transporter [Elusimicrobiaceae bacterium]|nr:AI-2E family transporter [Elusimicrobiaceae bacterium]